MKKIFCALLLVAALASPVLAVRAPHAECCFDGDPWCCVLYILEKASGIDW